MNDLNNFTNSFYQNDNINKKENFKPIYPLVDNDDLEYTGLMIQITHSPYYASLHNKEDSYHGISCELLSQQIVSTTSSIATDVCDRKKAEFLATASSLAYIDGGEQTIVRINDLISDDKMKIKQSDLLEKNFLLIFSNKDEEFRKTYLHQLKYIYDDVEDEELTNEVIAVKLAYALKLIARYMSIRNNWDYIETSNFLFDELLKIKKRAKETGRLEITEEMKRTIEAIKKYFDKTENGIDLSDLESLVQRYLSSEITKEQFIDELLNYSSKKKVKG